MSPVRFFFGRALQILGMATMTYVVFMFFTQMDMNSLLTWTIVGACEFYGGTLLLGKSNG